MTMQFNFEGLQGQLVIENPTFRSIEQAEKVVQDQGALGDYIDQAAHAGEDIG